MKVVIAMDSFKGSLSAIQAGNAVAEGIRRVFGKNECEIVVRPLADGGEGTVEAFSLCSDVDSYDVKVHGPLFDVITSSYAIFDNDTAFIEMAAASGLTLVPVEKRDPLHTTTYGTGELIKDAIKRGIRKFVIGIGGSATNDGGAGMLQALGFSFLDEDGNDIPFGAEGLEKLYEIRECEFRVACDVKNPLCGKNGASRVFGPQKGADPEMIVRMDAALRKYADLTLQYNPGSDDSAEGAGAAGGLGFAFMSYLGGKLLNGAKLIIELTELEKYLENADVVVTGEGRLDSQSVMGKAPTTAAAIAKKHGAKVVAFSGCVSDDARKCNSVGCIDAYFPVLRMPCSLDDAMDIENAYTNLRAASEQVFRLIGLYEKKE